MRVLLVIDSFGQGGAQRQLITLANGLAQSGHDVDFFVYYPEYSQLRSALTEKQIHVHEVHKRWRYTPRVVLALIRLIRRLQFDVVLSFLPTPNVYCELASMVCPATAFVVSERLAFETLPLSRWQKVGQQLHRLADHVTVNSEHQRAQLEHCAPWLRHRISTIYNGIDLAAFSPDATKRVHAGPTRLLAIGTVSSRKNVLGAIRALEAYRDRFSICPTIDWIGEPKTTDDQVVLNECRLRLQKNGLGSHFVFRGRCDDIRQMLHSHDALFHPSHREGLSNAIGEAMAAGLPVLAGDVCDNPRLVRDGENGFLFDPRDADSVADAIRSFVMLDEDSRHRMGAQSRVIAERMLSSERCIEAYERLFTEAVARKRQGRRACVMCG